VRFALINGRRVAYETSGDPDGLPVLIIHGAWGGPSSTLWNGPRIRWTAATQGLRLLWYDRRCAGLSQYDDQLFTLEDLSNDAVDVLNYLGFGRAAVVATSAGGPIGLRLALDHPGRVESLVLLNTGDSLLSRQPSGVSLNDPFVRDRLATVQRRLCLLDDFERIGAQALLEVEAEWREPPLAGSDDLSLSSARTNRLLALSRVSRSELLRLAAGVMRNMAAQRGIDLGDELARIECPALIVHGDSDTTVPIAFGHALKQALPDSELITLAGVGHGLIVNPQAQTIVAEWLLGMSSTIQPLAR